MKRLRQLNIFQELIIDNFAGGGGASIGIEKALGHPVDIAINHNEEALAMHEANHPLTKHFCENVWDVNPVDVADGKPVALAWFSPDCKHFSKAKGGKPVSKKIRGLAWVALRYAATVKPRVIILENVEEFVTWGPLTKEGMPCQKRKGKTFQAFVNALKRQGYEVEYKELRACDYGAPTIRKRFFLIARCDGQNIVWPEPTHGAPTSEGVKSGKLKPWRTAGECIDWSIPCPSIFERDKPLAEATLRRIARGIQKYVIDAKKPFIVTCNHQGESFRGQGVDEPMKTITASRDAHGVVMPTLMHYRDQPGGVPRFPSLDEPLGTVTAGGVCHSLLVPTLIQTGYGERPGQAPRVPGLEKPIGTLMGGGQKHALAVASLVKHYGGHYNAAGIDLNEPIHTITAQDHHALVTSSLVKLYGTSTGAEVNDPMPTVTATGQHIGEVRAFLSRFNGKPEKGEGAELESPAGTVTARDRFALVTIDSVDYVIVDIGMRMLQPHELFKAQGFPDDYIIAPEYKGKKLTKTAQVRMVGNSVSPMVAEALVRANVTLAQSKRRAG